MSRAADQARRAHWHWLVALIVLAALASDAAAAVRASLDRTQVYEGDRVQLRIEVEGPASNDRPDLSVLENDFEVAGTSQAQQTQIINGRRSDRLIWQVALEPRRLGTLTVPPIAVAGQRTEPLQVQVEPMPEGGLGAPGDQVWLEVELEADANALVVQQQVPLVVRAYSAKPLVDYRIEVPAIEGAVLTRIGRDTGHITTRAGEQYRVIERRFTLNPERSGTLRIPPITFDAELRTARAGRAAAARGIPDLFDDPMFERMLGGIGVGSGLSMFERGEPARARSEALSLDVAPSPEGFSGDHWLPAAELEVEDSWSAGDGGAAPSLAVGEPATRTLTLIAKGLAGNQIPEIEVPVPDGFRVYPETVEADTRSDGETVIGVSRQQVTLIPTRGGDLVLPRIEIPWWDTDAGAERTLVVPALPITVAGPVAPPDAAASGETGSEAAAGATPDSPAQVPDAGARDPRGGLGAGLGFGLVLVVVLVMGLLGGLLLAAVGWRLWQRRRRPPRRERVPGEGLLASPRRAAKEGLRRACERDDPRAAAQALLQWARWRWPDDPPAGLGGLAERVPPAQREVLEALERTLYGVAGAESDWRGDALWQQFKADLGGGASARRSGPAARAEPLAPLYPDRA